MVQTNPNWGGNGSNSRRNDERKGTRMSIPGRKVESAQKGENLGFGACVAFAIIGPLVALFGYYYLTLPAWEEHNKMASGQLVYPGPLVEALYWLFMTAFCIIGGIISLFGLFMLCVGVIGILYYIYYGISLSIAWITKSAPGKEEIEPDNWDDYATDEGMFDYAETQDTPEHEQIAYVAPEEDLATVKQAVSDGDGQPVEDLTNKKAKEDLNLSLLEASKAGIEETVKILLTRGADVNTQDYYGFTPLMKAARSGHSELVETLIRAGADPKAKNMIGKTAWDLAGLNKEVRQTLSTPFPKYGRTFFS